MTYSVNPPDLYDGSRLIGHSAGELDLIPGQLGRMLRTLGEAAGSPDVVAAGYSAVRRWQPAMEGVAQQARSLSRGLGAAGANYGAADSTARGTFAAGER